VHRSREPLALDRRRLGDLLVTSPARTIVDLAGRLAPAELEVAFESARRRRLCTADEVRATLERIGGTGRPGAAALVELLGTLEDQAPSDSKLEVLVARILRASGLPAPVRQHRVRIGRATYFLDFAWPKARVALECDSRRWHSDRDAFQRDRTKWSDLAARGWRAAGHVGRRPGPPRHGRRPDRSRPRALITLAH
jgi:hypothetical protein